MIGLPELAAHDVVDMLRRHYLPDGRAEAGIFAAEIESPDGRRRADAIWAPWSMTAGDELVGHEIKVARSDVLAELADPMKADPWLRYCTRWYLVLARPNLVDGLEVPDSWGIMAPPSGRRTRSMTIVRPAPKLKHGDTAAGWRRIATWDHVRLSAKVVEAAYQASRAKSELEYVQRELLERQLAGEGRAHPHAAKVGRILAELESRSWDAGRLDEATIIAALVDLGAARRLAESTRHEIEYLIAETKRIAAPMADTTRQLEKLLA